MTAELISVQRRIYETQGDKSSEYRDFKILSRETLLFDIRVGVISLILGFTL